jgi:DNA polymerase-3 subunit gamma/tau
MLSFAPQEAIASKVVSPQKKEIPINVIKPEIISKPNQVSPDALEIKKKIEVIDEIKDEETKETLIFNGNWRELVDQLKLGLVKALAQQSELVSFKNNEMILSIADEHKHLLNETYQKKLESSLSEYFNQRIKLVILQKGANNSPLKQKQEERSTLMKDTEEAMLQDQFVQSLLTEFNAEIIPSSIKPNQSL